MSQELQGLVERMEDHQVAVHLGAMAVDAALGWAAPAVGPGLEDALNPVLGALLYVTFLQVPAAELVRSTSGSGRSMVAMRKNMPSRITRSDSPLGEARSFSASSEQTNGTPLIRPATVQMETVRSSRFQVRMRSS